FFILAGEMMNRAGITIRLLNLAESEVGHFRGGLAHVNILASMMMAGISGSGAADTAAIGSTMIPAMEQKGYKTDFSVVLTASASVVGPIIPPSVLFILYGSLTNVSIGKLFLGGIIPGIIMSGSMMVTSYFICKSEGYGKVFQTFEKKRFLKASKKGMIALILPIAIVGSIITGFATATESGVIAVLLAIILGALFKTMNNFHVLKDTVINSMHTTAITFMILATSAIFSNILVHYLFQIIVLDVLNSLTNSPTIMLLLIIAFILIIGMFVDVTPIIIMFAAPMSLVADQLGYDPVFFGIILTISATIGAITPPVGGFLLISCGIGKIPVSDTLKIIMPYFITLVIALLIVAFLPSTVTFLPNYFME